MTSKLSIVLLESDNNAKNDIAAALKSCDINIGRLTATADFQEVIRLIKDDEPHIVFLDVKEIEQGVRETAYLVSRFPQTTVFVTATEKNPDWILRLIRTGASEYLTKPISASEVSAAIHRVSRFLKEKDEQAGGKGSVISLYNPSGGVGTTTIAVNLAATLAARGERVALVDLNLCCGDVTTFLNLSPRYTLANVTARQGRVDASFLQSVMIPHSSGVHVLCGPADLEEAGAIRPDQIREVVAILQGLYSYIIIDTSGWLFGCNLATLEISDKILYVAILSLPALKNTKRYLAAMYNEGLGPDRVKLIINRHIPKDEIKIADAERVINARAYMTVPNAYFDVKTSINKGVPLVTSNPKSPLTKVMDDLAVQLTGDITGGKRSASTR